jgi:hypothetical protein
LQCRACVKLLIDYMDAAGIANRGVVTLQLGQLLSNLYNDVTYGPAASAWNALVAENYAEWTGCGGAWRRRSSC